MQIIFNGIQLKMADIMADKHAGTYTDVIDVFEGACERLLEILNQAKAQLRMEMAEEWFGLPALVGVVKDIEADSLTKAASKHLRFRQFVGDCVRVFMERRGWHGTDDKSSIVSWATNYKKAGRFSKA
jgi:hypothetical protein